MTKRGPASGILIPQIRIGLWDALHLDWRVLLPHPRLGVRSSSLGILASGVAQRSAGMRFLGSKGRVGRNILARKRRQDQDRRHDLVDPAPELGYSEGIFSVGNPTLPCSV